MEKEDVNEYLLQGIYGPKEIKEEEKIRFLGTFRERVIIALTQSQVRKKEIYPEVENMILKYPKASLLLNGETGFDYVSKYVQLANRHKINYSMVADRVHDTDLGLVLANPDAVDIESVFVEDRRNQPAANANSDQEQPSFFMKLFGHKPQ